jgi:hypothetical protein
MLAGAARCLGKRTVLTQGQSCLAQAIRDMLDIVRTLERRNGRRPVDCEKGLNPQHLRCPGLGIVELT